MLPTVSVGVHTHMGLFDARRQKEMKDAWISLTNEWRCQSLGVVLGYRVSGSQTIWALIKVGGGKLSLSLYSGELGSVSTIL